jgi:hypothetical protein
MGVNDLTQGLCAVRGVPIGIGRDALGLEGKEETDEPVGKSQDDDSLSR